MDTRQNKYRRFLKNLQNIIHVGKFQFVSWIAVILFVFSIFVSCSEENPVLLLSQDFKDYCVFKKDSYWVYINDSTGEQDSAFVNHIPTVYFSDNPPWLEETVSVPITSSFFKDYYLRHHCSLTKPNTIDENSGSLSLFIEFPDEPGGPISAMWYNLPMNVEVPQCNCTEEYCSYMKSEFIDEMIVRGNQFRNVLHTNFHSSDTSLSNPNFFSYHYYFVKNVGLIQFKERSAKYNSYRSFSISRWKVQQ